MDHSDLVVEVATHDDLPGILDLQERNLSEHGGNLSVRWCAEWFEKAIREMPIIVARSGERVVGYLVSTPQGAQAQNPIIEAMLAAYPASADAYIYGPICVEQEQRKRGVAALMFRHLRMRLPSHEGLTFIRGDNIAARAVAANLEMREAGKFKHRGLEYMVMVYIA